MWDVQRGNLIALKLECIALLPIVIENYINRKKWTKFKDVEF